MTRATRPVAAGASEPLARWSLSVALIMLLTYSLLASASAFAPPTISLISCVISA